MKWQAVAWLLMGFGVLVAILSPIYATIESHRRLDAWAQNEISRTQVDPWPGVFTGGAIAGLGVIASRLPRLGLPLSRVLSG